ncbi:EF-hand domain-containing protein [Allorhizobium undicola]|uniref:EF-hand domain-containing protein n=1 Tax=Allorhizobium undicola TaxID=78527 RepID=UPI0004822332|nr:EF-hand domain-containing protein [Allorhizobium undicola]
MTSVSSTAASILSSYTSSSSSSSLDTDGDGVVSATELAAAGVSRTQDPTVLTENAATSAGSQLSGGLALLLAEDSSSTSASQSSMPAMPSAEDRFNEMDADGDGKVTESEFTAAAPEGVSEEDSAKLFAELDTSDAGYLTQDQLSADQPQGPPGPPMMQGMSLAETLSSSDSDDDSDTISMDDVFEHMRAVIDAYRANESTSSTAASTATSEQAA